jgi:5'-methylthioadenosine phosphorylase
LYRSWGCSVIGMTNMPEAKLAREAEICYVSVAMVTDFDCWHNDHDAVTVDQVIKIMQQNAEQARNLVRAMVPILGRRQGLCDAGCDRALEHAIVTSRENISEPVASRLDAVAGRILRRS